MERYRISAACCRILLHCHSRPERGHFAGLRGAVSGSVRSKCRPRRPCSSPTPPPVAAAPSLSMAARPRPPWWTPPAAAARFRISPPPRWCCWCSCFSPDPLSYLPSAVLATIVFLIGLELIDHRGLVEIYRKTPTGIWGCDCHRGDGGVRRSGSGNPVGDGAVIAPTCPPQLSPQHRWWFSTTSTTVGDWKRPHRAR